MRKLLIGLMLAVMLVVLLGNNGCNQPVSRSGITPAEIKITRGADGLTTEQRSVKRRLEEDNKVGSIKHLYIISAYSGQVLVYSTVQGKVTSGGKRLTPTTVRSDHGFAVNFGGSNYYTTEVLQDDGTYGHSMDYLYWWDARGMYHQVFPTGGTYIHISNEPISVKSVVMNLEMVEK